MRIFLSTPSARRATLGGCDGIYYHAISIHALREEGDARTSRTPATRSDFYPRPPRGGRLITATMRTGTVNFYPRPPRGGRPSTTRMVSASPIFLSTPSARRATLRAPARFTGISISIHALREEGDKPPAQRLQPLQDFYPRPPRGGRRNLHLRQRNGRHISIHALREEGDLNGCGIR